MARPKKRVDNNSTVDENATVQPTINEQETTETTPEEVTEDVVEEVKVEVNKEPRVMGTTFDTETKATKPVETKTNSGDSLVIIRGRGFINPNPQVVSDVVLEILKKRKGIKIEYVTNR